MANTIKEDKQARKEELAKTIEDGFKAATEAHSNYTASLPCVELLRVLTDRTEREGLNVEDLLNSEGIKKPGRADRVGKTIDLLLSVSENSGHPLTMLNGRACYYNGKFWEPVNDLDLGYFLTRAAQVLGVQHYEAMYCDFIRKAADTFKLSARALVPPRPAGVSLLNCSNGTVEITTQGARLRKHRPEDGLLYVLPYNFDPEATAPRFSQFLREVLPLEPDRDNVQEFCGSLFSDIKTEKLLYLYGATGNNGKTTFKDIICSALGASNVSTVNLSQITDRGGTGETARAALEGKLLNACGETDREISSADIFKQIVSREPMSVRPPYEKTVHNIPRNGYARLMFCCNELPVFTKGAAKAEARRFLFIEFAKEVEQEKINIHLTEDITSFELSGVLNWIIEGAMKIAAQQGKFTENPHADLVCMEFLEGSNSVLAYLNTYGIKPATPYNVQRYRGRVENISPRMLYNYAGLFEQHQSENERESYCLYCANNNLKAKGKNNFLLALRQLGFTEKRTEKDRMLQLLILDPEEIYKENEKRAGTLEPEIF